jgi:hypothetical protein
VGAALAWQIAFFVIATDPARYRPLMIPSVFEKFSYGIAVVILVAQDRMLCVGSRLRRYGFAARRSLCRRLRQNTPPDPLGLCIAIACGVD